MEKFVLPICLCLMLSATKEACSQTADDNYVKVYKATVPLTGNISAVNDKNKVVESVDYFDGLGRPVQSIARQATPQGNDMVTFMVYDAFGRKTKNYLPYATTSTTGNVRTSPIPDQLAFYQSLHGTVDGQNAFAVQLVEDSDLNRVMKQGAPGADWQPGSTDIYNTTDRTVKKRYEVNGSNEVFLFTYNAATSKIELGSGAAGYYTAGQLNISKTIDEHGNDVVTYSDKQNQTVCKKVKVNATEYAFTYYIYDDKGKLAAVLSPEGVKAFVEFYVP